MSTEHWIVLQFSAKRHKVPIGMALLLFLAVMERFFTARTVNREMTHLASSPLQEEGQFGGLFFGSSEGVPADIEKLIETFNEPAAAKRPERSVPLKRISVIIRENQEQIIERWLTHCRSNPELSQAAAQHGPVDHLPRLLLEIADRIENHPEKTSMIAVAAAADHGILKT